MSKINELDPILWQSLGVIALVVLVLTVVTFFLENVCSYDRYWRLGGDSGRVRFEVH